jgi:hypothetical protein
MYKTELHAHSCDVSLCANAPAEHIVEKYIAAGYDAIVLSNHFNYDTFRGRIKDIPFDAEHKAEYWRRMVDLFWYGIEHLERAASDSSLHVIPGIEIRFNENFNDYLCYGITREFMYDNPDMLDIGSRRFVERSRAAGMLFFQAHPFRYGMTTKNPKELDGVEIYNGHPWHNSNNDIAEAWAKKHRLLWSCGTDHHDLSHPATSGILTDEPVRDNETLLKVLREQNFEIVRGLDK